MFVLGSRMEEFYERLNLEQPGGGALVELILASVAGAWLYTEGQTAAGGGGDLAA